MAAVQGVVRGPQDLADYADTLSQGQLRAWRFRVDPHTCEVRRPKKTTVTRVLREVDDDLMERVLRRWQDQIWGSPQDRVVIFDGKKVGHAGVEIVNAVDSQGRFLGSVIADAMHTQDETGQQILFEKGADYLLTVKGNQSTLQTNLESLFGKKCFFPSAHFPDPGAQTGAQPQPVGDPTFGLPGSNSQPSGLSRSPFGGAIGNARETPG